jgi:hypothetical protein
MHTKLPYFKERPHIPLKLGWQDREAHFIPLLDTGADFSVFHKSDALWLGIDWSKGKEMELSNADGSSFYGRQFNLTVDIEGYKLPARICFTENTHYDMPLLGRADIFQHFRITVDEKAQHIEVQSHS